TIELNLPQMRAWLQGLLKRRNPHFARYSPQLPLFQEKPMPLPAEVQEIFDRLQAKAAAVASTHTSGEDRANRPSSPPRSLFSTRGDLSPYTSQSQKLHQVTPL